PSVPGPALAADGHPLQEGLRVDGPAAAWVHALLAGHEVLDGEGSGSRALRRANGAVFLAGRASAGGAKGGGPLQRRADLDALAQEVADAEAARGASAAALERTLAELAAAEAAFATAAEAAEQARHQELEAAASKGDAERAAAHAQREAADATAQVERLSTRLSEVEARLTALHGEVDTHEVERVRLDERLGGERQRLVELETGQEAAREQRVKWQVDAAQVEARLAAARERAARAAAETDEARHQVATLVEEIAALVEGERGEPLDRLLAEAAAVAGDVEWLRQENERLRAAIDEVGPVNALAVDEHGEEMKRLEFLMTQRDDLVAARQSLQQAAR